MLSCRRECARRPALRNVGRRSLILLLLVSVVVLVAVESPATYGQLRRRAGKASQADGQDAAGPRDYESRNFVLHTDLSPGEAEELLERLEKVLAIISKYWGRRNRKPIECYVVRDLANWPEGSLHSVGRQKIVQQSGVTITRTVTNGRRFNAKSIVFAIADRGTPQHEAVHAYCSQTFGRTGPTWYSEGMAEMGQYWREGDRSVNCPSHVIDYIRRSPPKTLNEIVNGQAATGDSWQDYAWRWALCHLLANNTNYAERFRPLGLGLLTGKKVSFERVYGSMAREISFEYLFFLKHLEAGYRVDLCSWDWEGRYRAPRTGKGTAVRVKAGAGWQGSGLQISRDTEYSYAATGTWALTSDGEDLTADGIGDGSGRLLAVIMNEDYELSEPIELGTEGTFRAPDSGRLFLRCQDGWGSLADNSGQITARIATMDD